MKLLLDENLSRRLVPFLQSDFPGSSHVALLGLEQASDRHRDQKLMGSFSTRRTFPLKYRSSIER
jgi:hypothetical protein